MKSQSPFPPSRPRWPAVLVLACLLGLFFLRDPHGDLGHEPIARLFQAFGKGHGLYQVHPSGSPSPQGEAACAFYLWSSTLSTIALSASPAISLPNPLSPIPAFIPLTVTASWFEPFHSRAPPLPA